jgi:uncharacterized membrane protein YbhN (UPF0104 family)
MRTVAVPRSAARVLSGAVAVVVIAVLVQRLGNDPFVAALSAATLPALVLALAIGGGTTALSALRWVRAAGLLGLPLPPARALRDYYASLFLNAVLPGGVLGDVRRAALHGRDAGRMGGAAGALLLERSAGQLVLVVAAAATWLAVPSAVPGPATAWRFVAVALGVAALAVVVRFALVLPRLRVRDVAAMLAASVAVLAGHVGMFVLAARTAGVDGSVVALLPLALVALLAMSLPLNLAGWGPREGATAWAFAGAGLGAGRGVTVAVLYGLFALVASLPGALVLMAPRSRRGEPRRQAVPQEDQVVDPAHVGQQGAAPVLGGQAAPARQARRARLPDEEGRDRDLELVGGPGAQERAEHDGAPFHEQAPDAAVVQVRQHRREVHVLPGVHHAGHGP